MHKELFKLRNAALAAAIALTLGAAPSFADELAEPTGDETSVALEPAPADVDATLDEGLVIDDGAALDEGLVPDDGVVQGELPGEDFSGEFAGDDDLPPEDAMPGDEVVIDDPAPGDEGLIVIDDPLLVDEPVALDDPVTLDEPEMVEDGGVLEVTAVDGEPIPMRGPDGDCGMICWNSAIDPAVLRGNESPDDKVFDKDIEVDTAGLDGGVAAELGGAIGAAEQIGATHLGDEVLGAEPPMDMASAGGGSSVIRGGHLR